MNSKHKTSLPAFSTSGSADNYRVAKMGCGSNVIFISRPANKLMNLNA